MGKKVDAVIFPEVGRIEVGQVELNDLGPNEVMVKTLYTFGSSGTELRVLGAKYITPDRFPVVPGYSVVAQVVEIGRDVKGYCVGDLVTGRNPKDLIRPGSAWGGHAAYHIYPTKTQGKPLLLPAGADPRDYLLSEVSAISFRGVDSASPRPGESAVVIGQGVIGAFSAAWLKWAKCRVVAVEVLPGRLARAMARGLDGAVNPNAPDAVDRVKALTNGGADIVVETSGTPAGLEMAFKLLRRKTGGHEDDAMESGPLYGGYHPRLVAQANYIDPLAVNPLAGGEALYISMPVDRSYSDRMRVMENIRQGALKTDDFVDSILPYTQAPQAYVGLRDNPDKIFSIAFNWSGAK
jgi:L-iditol 2-dehydrogenase